MLNVKQIANEDIYSTPTAPCACLDWIRFTFHYMCMTCCHISIWSICFLRPLMLKGLNVHWFQFQLWNSLLHYNMWYGCLGSDFPGSRLCAWLAATNGEDLSDGRSWASGNLLNKTRITQSCSRHMQLNQLVLQCWGSQRWDIAFVANPYDYKNPSREK